MPDMATHATTPTRRQALASRPLAFRRLHGLGNDYVFVDDHELRGLDPGEVACAVADRHRGIGGDGLISVALVEPDARGGPARLRMRMWNADGSPSGMCGNGVRGVVRYAVEEGLVEAFGDRAMPREMIVEIGDREARCRVVAIEPVFRVVVDMGRASFDWESVPCRPVRPIRESVAGRLHGPGDLEALGVGTDAAHRWRGWGIASMGNPHLVLVATEDRDLEDLPLEAIGGRFERAPAFPERTNVHLARVEGRGRFRLRTWERGSGVTLACGSGACAAFALLSRCGAVDEVATARLDGGDLDLALGDHERIEMTGPSEPCCTGTADLAALLANLGRGAGPAARPVPDRGFDQSSDRRSDGGATCPPLEIELAEGGAP